ncbi:MAG: hypothetical protein JWP69_1134 [Flaviaesturariibacter sp.]|nr:hypothetical protein [Flaviaesturariibacter sp.]
MLLLIACSFLFIGYAALILFYKRGWERLGAFSKTDSATAYRVKVSVIIAARNEEGNIAQLLKALQLQTYPPDCFEVIVVDDHSTDLTTTRVLDYSSIQLISLPDGITSKKKAISTGIEHAAGELIITTDADCLPGTKWLETIVHFYKEKNAQFIAAPVQYHYQNNLVELFQTMDFLTLQGITAASVATNFHSMCNGANLAYTKQAFMNVNGFAGIDTVASGDDMLLMHKIWKQHPQNVFYLKAPAAIVQTAPMPTWKEFFWQRIRWASKTTAYDDKRIFWALLLVYLFNLQFIVLAIAGFWNSLFWSAALCLLVLKTAVELPFFYSVAKFYHQQKLVRFFFLFQPLHILYTVVIGALSQTGSYQWKGRKTK